MLNKADIIAIVNDLRLPNGGYWVCTGAGLVLHGIKEFTRDIDMGCTTQVMDRLLREGHPLSFTSDGNRATSYGAMEFYENWFADEVVTVEGVSVATLLSIRKHKTILGREKDLRDIELIDAYLSTHPQ